MTDTWIYGFLTGLIFGALIYRFMKALVAYLRYKRSNHAK